MWRIRQLACRVVCFLFPKRAERELKRELGAHLALLEDEFARGGMSPDEARAAATRAIGGVQQAKEGHRDQRSFRWVEETRSDFAYAFRGFLRNPGFAFVAALTVALGVGANTTIFSVVNDVLIEPLGYDSSGRFVRIVEERLPPPGVNNGFPTRSFAVLLGEYIELRDRSRSLSHIAAYSQGVFTLRGSEGSARVVGARVAASTFDMLDVQPILGRAFAPDEDREGNDGAVILSYGTWQTRFGGDPGVIGLPLTLDGRAYSVIGVMGPGIEFPDPGIELWLPFVLPQPAAFPTQVAVVARLAEDATLDVAEAEVNRILADVRGVDIPSPDMEPLVTLTGVSAEAVRSVRPALLVLSFAVALVLLIACTNVANLMLARTMARQREIAVRAALGGGRGRLVRQSLSESLVLAIAGGVVGSALAWGGVGLVRNLAPATFPRLDAISVDATVFSYALAISVLVGFLFGLAPALRYVRIDHSLVANGGRDASPGVGLFRPGNRTRSVLVIAETGMAALLLIGAGLLGHSFLKLVSVDAGYDPGNVLTFRVALPRDEYPLARQKAFASNLLLRVQSMPEVLAAGLTNNIPFSRMQLSFARLPLPPPPEGPVQRIDTRVVSEAYFDALGIRVVEGRGFDENDRAGQPGVMLVNEALVAAFFRGESPIGTFALAAFGPEPWEIVGVANDVRQFGLALDPAPQFFMPFRQLPDSFGGAPQGWQFAVRTEGDPLAIVAAIRAAVDEADPQAALDNVVEMREVVSRSVAGPRFYAITLGAFAAIAVLLAAVGVYGVLAYSISRRTREIGVRMALGAHRRAVLRLVLGQAGVLGILGLAIGLAGAVALTRYLDSLLFGLTPLDPVTFAGVSLAFALIAGLAAYLPARHATRVDPVVALRHD